MDTDVLYYGDNLDILRKYIPENSIDLIYLDPPFNSKATYNVLYKEPTGKPSQAQISAFEDTWHWGLESERSLQEIAASAIAPSEVKEFMSVLPKLVGKRTDMASYLTMMYIRLIELRRVLRDTGSIYLHCDPTASHYLKLLMDTIFGSRNFRREVVWRSGWVSVFKTRSGNWTRNHDILLYYVRNVSSDFTFNKDLAYKPHEPDYKRRGGGENPKGVAIDDVWDDNALYSPWIKSFSKEKLGYMTQKPVTLLERIMSVSSKPGDIILDPFCGCGTTVLTAQRLGRKWIGIDITYLVIGVMEWRLKNMVPMPAYKVIGEPEDLASALELANKDKYQFQWWAVTRIGGQPYGDKKKGADTGIDGYLYYMDEKDKIKKAIISVKGGGTSVKDIRDLRAVIDREKAEIGIFLTLQEPTKPMKTEATTRGFYHSRNGRDYPRIQILTIEEIFQGKSPDIPPWIAPITKPASVKKAQGETAKLL